MAVVPETDGTVRIMSSSSLFVGLFFGLGGGLVFITLFVLCLIYWRYVRLGRIRLGSGGPGDLDDEQRFLEEERAAMEQFDVSQQDAYYRARGAPS
jgi:hypothetical protein